MAHLIRNGRGRRGFTFVELMVVIAIIGILLAMAMPHYFQTIRASREAVLRSNLLSLRAQIQNFVCEKQRAPQSLNELVATGYFYELPMDPMTKTRDWHIVYEQPEQAVNQNEPGIFNVHSTSPDHSADGSAYAEW